MTEPYLKQHWNNEVPAATEEDAVHIELAQRPGARRRQLDFKIGSKAGTTAMPLDGDGCLRFKITDTTTNAHFELCTVNEAERATDKTYRELQAGGARRTYLRTYTESDYVQSRTDTSTPNNNLLILNMIWR